MGLYGMPRVVRADSPVAITDPGTTRITKPGKYYLANDVENVYVFSKGVTLDGKWHSVGDIVWAREAPYFRLKNIKFTGDHGPNLFVHDSDYSRVEHIVSPDQRFLAVHASECKHLRIHQVRASVQVLRCTKTEVTNCNFGRGEQPFKLWRSEKCLVKSNKSRGDKKLNVICLIEDSHKNEIRNNRFENARVGVSLWHSNKNDVDKNKLCDTDIPVEDMGHDNEIGKNDC